MASRLRGVVVVRLSSRRLYHRPLELLDDGALENSLAWPTAVYAPKLENALTDELALALAGTTTAEQAITDAHQAWTEIIETNG